MTSVNPFLTPEKASLVALTTREVMFDAPYHKLRAALVADD